MSLKDAYRQKIEARIEEEKARLDLLKARMKQTLADGKIMAYEEIAETEKKLEQLRSKVKELAVSSEGAWEEVKGGVEKAWKELGEASKKAAARFGNHK
jgi:hypothetical protein